MVRRGSVVWVEVRRRVDWSNVGRVVSSKRVGCKRRRRRRRLRDWLVGRIG